MDTKYLTTFVTILEAGSFQKAAEKLNYTQSTVTSQIRQLEEEFDVKLFEKIGRKMALTQAGKDILPFVRSILKNTEEIYNYKKAEFEMTGSLCLVAPDSIFIYLLQPVIKEFRQRAPHVRLMVNSLPSEEINSAVMNGQADIGVDCDKGVFPDSLIHKPGKPFNACLIASPNMSEEYRDFVTPKQQKPLSIILNEPKANYQKAFELYLVDKGITLEPSMKLQSIEAVKRSVINGLGIAYVPAFSVKAEIDRGELIQLETGIDDKIYPGTYIYHKNKWISPQMRLMLEIIAGQKDII